MINMTIKKYGANVRETTLKPQEKHIEFYKPIGLNRP